MLRPSTRRSTFGTRAMRSVIKGTDPLAWHAPRVMRTAWATRAHLCRQNFSSITRFVSPRLNVTEGILFEEAAAALAQNGQPAETDWPYNLVQPKIWSPPAVTALWHGSLNPGEDDPINSISELVRNGRPVVLSEFGSPLPFLARSRPTIQSQVRVMAMGAMLSWWLGWVTAPACCTFSSETAGAIGGEMAGTLGSQRII